MAAVLAAIGAALLAGWVALFREHRIQQRQLLVAARIMDEAFAKTQIAIDVSRESDDWKPINLIPTSEEFVDAWDAVRTDLAGHLKFQEWNAVAGAVASCEVIRGMAQESPPQDSDALRALEPPLGMARDQLDRYRRERLTVGRLLQRHYRRGDWAR
jgi:hypothetical protein